MGIPVRVSFLADCYLSFHWVANKFWKTNSGPLWCVYFRPWTYWGGLSYCNQLRNIHIPEKQVFVGMGSLLCCYSSAQWQCYCTALPIRETISKCSWWTARGPKQMAVLVQHAAHAPNRHQFSLSMQVFSDLHLTSNLELKIESCALQGSVNHVFNGLKYTTS